MVRVGEPASIEWFGAKENPDTAAADPQTMTVGSVSRRFTDEVEDDQISERQP